MTSYLLKVLLDIFKSMCACSRWAVKHHFLSVCRVRKNRVSSCVGQVKIVGDKLILQQAACLLVSFCKLPICKLRVSESLAGVLTSTSSCSICSLGSFGSDIECPVVAVGSQRIPQDNFRRLPIKYFDQSCTK